MERDSWSERLEAHAAARRVGPNLVAAWFETRPEGELRGRSAAYLAECTGRFCDANTLAAMATGRRPVPQEIQALMRREVLAMLMGEDRAARVAPLMEPPER